MAHDPQDELEAVAATLAKLTGKPLDKCRRILIAASQRPTFYSTDLLLKLSPTKVRMFLETLRQEAPCALTWFLAGCRNYKPIIRHRDD